MVETLVLPENDVAFIFDKSASLPATPQGKRNRSVVKVIVLSKSFLDMAGSFLRVVVGHGGKEMVGNVGI